MWGRLEVGYREVRLAISLEEANLWRSGIHRRWISLSKVYIYQTIILHLFKYFVCAKKNIVRTFLTPTQRGLTSFFQVSIYHDSVFTVKHLYIRLFPHPVLFHGTTLSPSHMPPAPHRLLCLTVFSCCHYYFCIHPGAWEFYTMIIMVMMG